MNGVIKNFNVANIDTSDFTYCTCKPNYVSFPKFIPGINKTVPLCINSNIFKIFKNQKSDIK
jgi:hypothetical protein